MRAYEPRHVTFLGHYHALGATLKVYGVSLGPAPPGEAIVAEARRLADRALAEPRTACRAGGVDWAACEDHGVGTLIVHAAREAVFVLLDCWVGENMLRHHVWSAPLRDPHRFEALPASVAAMCVWEMAVLQHERNAWLTHVLTPDGRSDVGAYLDDVMRGAV